MRITLRCTLISLSAIVSQNRLNPIMQRAKIDRSVQRALPVYDSVVFLGYYARSTIQSLQLWGNAGFVSFYFNPNIIAHVVVIHRKLRIINFGLSSDTECQMFPCYLVCMLHSVSQLISICPITLYFPIFIALTPIHEFGWEAGLSFHHEHEWRIKSWRHLCGWSISQGQAP